MTDILVTQTAVRNLASILSRGDTQTLKHTERLALIAEAFGWKTDAFMHSLKSQNAKLMSSTPKQDVGNPLVATSRTKKISRR